MTLTITQPTPEQNTDDLSHLLFCFPPFIIFYVSVDGMNIQKIIFNVPIFNALRMEYCFYKVLKLIRERLNSLLRSNSSEQR